MMNFPLVSTIPAVSMRLLLPCALTVLLALPGAAAVTEGSRTLEYELLLRMSPTAVSFIGDKSEPDAQGFTGANQRDGKWYEAGTQRGGCRMLIGAVVSGDLPRADAAWRAVEATFARQLEDGGFESNLKPGLTKPPTRADRVETAYFFLQELGRAILVIEASPMAGHFGERITALKPKLRRAADFIQSGYGTIVFKVGHTANRLLIAAKAFGLCGIVLEDETLKESSAKLVAEALKRRDAEGVFIERGGRDSSYNAVSLLMGQVLLLYLPNPELEAAMHRTMAWLLTRIDAEGVVSVEGNTRTGVGLEPDGLGHTKNVNYPEVAQALCYYGTLHNRPDLLTLAEKVAVR
ncbi:MAG: hypothetical protein GX580_12820 [Candidatus Hydrogenedens sp.]|nr:hypothetical protein [Candidatus Hydrogenedens sp.]